MRPHLVRWEDEYAAAGLVVIEVNQSIGESLKVMREMVVSQKLKHPVLWDAGCQNTKVYGITVWPTAYLIGADGKVFWEGNPMRWIRNDRQSKQMRNRLAEELARTARYAQSTK